MQVDFLAARSFTSEELAAMAAKQEEKDSKTRKATALVDGVPVQFTVLYEMRFKTNGGHMIDVRMAFDGQETEHRCGKLGWARELPHDGAL